MLITVGSQVGPYAILGLLGAGGMGEVFRARDSRLGRDVAIKVLPEQFERDPERLRRFEHEARAAGALNHPNILAIYDIGTHDGVPYVVSELLEGETLGDRLHAGPLPIRKALDYAIQILRGLAAAHEKGIIHRDLKPDNLFLTRDSRIKILDFGLAKLIDPEDGGARPGDSVTGSLTETGQILGTVGYMAPEQLRGKRADRQSDLFAFGCILYEMLSGKRAFHGGTHVDSMYAIMNLEPQSLGELRPEVPAALEVMVRHCLEKNPVERAQSARDVAIALQAIGTSPGAPANPSGVGAGPDEVGVDRVTRAPSRRKRRLLISFGLAAAGVLAGVWLQGRFVHAPVPEYQRLTFRRGYVTAARFSPDGQTIIYGGAWQGHPREISSTLPGQSESRSFDYPGADLLSVSSLGEMAIKLPNATLARVPLAGGAPREMLEKVWEADWAPDGRELAITRVVNGKFRIEYPIGKPILELPTRISHPRVSRDGKWVAFMDHSSSGDEGAAIAVVDRRGQRKTLTRWWAWLEGIAWSPSGHELWFTASDAGAAKVLYAVDLRGRMRVVLRGAGGLVLHDLSRDGRVLLSRSDFRVDAYGSIAGEKSERNLSWLDQTTVCDLSADGRTLLFVEEGEGSGPHYTTFAMKTDGSPPVRLFDGLGMTLSPDGRWALALTTDRRPPLSVQPTGPGTARGLERGPIQKYDWASWFPDGKRIVLSGFERGGLARCYMQDIDGGPPRAFTPPGTYLYNPGAAVSPNGKLVLVRHSDGPYLHPVDGGPAQKVSGVPSDSYAIRWSPDGRSLYLAVVTQGHILRLDIASGRKEFWMAPTPVDSAGIRVIAPVVISADGQSYVYSMQRELADLYLVKGLR